MITQEHKVADLLTEYPFLKEKLIKRNMVFKRLNNPVLFKSVGRFARLQDVAKASGENLQELLDFINKEIVKKS